MARTPKARPKVEQLLFPIMVVERAGKASKDRERLKELIDRAEATRIENANANQESSW